MRASIALLGILTWAALANAEEPIAPAPAPREPMAVAPAPDPFAVTPATDEINEAALGRAQSLLRLGDLPGAARAFRAAAQHAPNDVRAHEGLRNTYATARRLDLLPPVLATLAKLYLDAGDRERSGQRLDELALLAPEHADRATLEKALGRDGKTRGGTTHWTARLRSFLGIFVILGLAWLFSTSRKSINYRIVLWGLGLQAIFGVIVLWTPPGRAVFNSAQGFVDRIIAFSDEGASFLFGNIYRGISNSPRGALGLVDSTSLDIVNIGLVFAIHVLPTIIFIGSLMSVLYHFGIIQKVVRGIAWVMSRTMNASGAEALSTAANIFVGQTEAPLVVKPYVGQMTMSELMAVMVGGFATTAGGVLAAYVRFGVDAGHLMAASFMGGPATLVLAKMMVPETEQPLTAGKDVQDPPLATTNFIDAAAAGASEGLSLALNVGAMLIAFIALVAMVNFGLGFVGISLGDIFGWAFYPFSFFLGADIQDLQTLGRLLGIKISLNEFVAYVELVRLKSTMSDRSFVIATYALCGFANFSSIGIQLGGIGAMAPNRRGDLAKLGLRAMFAGALATALTACIAGILV